MDIVHTTYVVGSKPEPKSRPAPWTEDGVALTKEPGENAVERSPADENDEVLTAAEIPYPATKSLDIESLKRARGSFGCRHGSYRCSGHELEGYATTENQPAFGGS